MTGYVDGVAYEICRHCHEGIKRRTTTERPWVHTKTGKARSAANGDHHAEPVDDAPTKRGNPVSRARPGWHGPPPS